MKKKLFIHVFMQIRPYFFILGLQIFFQNIKVGGGIKIKIIKKCMILHCKNAEMTILLSFLHFYSVKSYNFCYFFSPIQICFRSNNKKNNNNFYFYFFPSSALNILKKKICKSSIKKIRPNLHENMYKHFFS